MKKAILMCTCSFSCPSMEKVDFAELTERIRLEVPHDYMVLHPRLCEENGESMMEDLVRADGVAYVTPACKAEKQKKLLRDGFDKGGFTMDHRWKPVSLSFSNTEQALTDIQQALEEIG